MAGDDTDFACNYGIVHKFVSCNEWGFTFFSLTGHFFAIYKDKSLPLSSIKVNTPFFVVLVNQQKIAQLVRQCLFAWGTQYYCHHQCMCQ